MAGSLDGPMAKLQRAYLQCAVLKREVETVWPPMQPWPVRRELDADGATYRFYLLGLPNIEPSWGLLAGEIMFDLRSSLDQLAYQLHERQHNGQIPLAIQKISEFPIYRDTRRFAKRGRSRITTLDEPERQTIEDLQPYNCLNDNWAETRDALGNLQTLHTIDKHRKLHLVASAQRFAVQTSYPDSFGFTADPIFGPMESYDHVDTWTFSTTPTEVHEHSGAFLQIVLQEAGRSFELVPNIEAMVGAVAAVLGLFADRFPMH
jgi:hypothetical protein